MTCQLKIFHEAGRPLSVPERFKNFLKKKMKRIVLKGKYLAGRGLKGIRRKKGIEWKPIEKTSVLIPDTLNLRPGEKVRVRELSEIKKTLDSHHKYQGLEYTPAMDGFCGGTFTVFNRIENAFDERRWKMSRVKNVVLLKDVFCDGESGMGLDWDGCDRRCFLWWKEAWLERLSE